MSEIVVVASRSFLDNKKDLLEKFDAKTLVVNKIVYEDLSAELDRYCSFLFERTASSCASSLVQEKKSLDTGMLFTSQNSLISLDMAIKKSEYFDFLRDIPSYIISKESASFARSLGFRVAFVGDKKHSHRFASSVIPSLKNKKVLFFRAENIVSGLNEQLLLSQIPFLDIIAYKNLPLRESIRSRPKQGSIIIFTAPSHVRSFIELYGWDKSYKAVVIGKSTQGACKINMEVFLSEESSLSSCLKKAKEIIALSVP